MKFSYYRRLNLRERRIYDRSDAASPITLPRPGELLPLVAAVEAGLRQDDRARTEAAVQRLVGAVLGRLQVPAVQTRVLAVRPSNRREELHGLYEYGAGRPQPVITVWMRTAQRRQPVAFRSFMRTLLHEVVHHLDYQHLHLADSYHTEGFYKRAESLYRQLVPVQLATRRETTGGAARSQQAMAPGAVPAAPASLRRAAAAATPAASRRAGHAPTPARSRPKGAPSAPARPEGGLQVARSVGSRPPDRRGEPAAREEQLVLPFE